jgi:PKD repeat protein
MAPPEVPRWQVAALLVVVVATSAGVFAYSAALPAASPRGSSGGSYCPLDVSSGMTFPQPGQTGNTSSNATPYPDGSVVFTASASGCVAPYAFTYNFGDGQQSQQPDVTHVYAGAGYYSGSLTVGDSAGHHSVTYFCVNATAWPDLSGGSGNPAPPCP